MSAGWPPVAEAMNAMDEAGAAGRLAERGEDPVPFLIRRPCVDAVQEIAAIENLAATVLLPLHRVGDEADPTSDLRKGVEMSADDPRAKIGHDVLSLAEVIERQDR